MIRKETVTVEKEKEIWIIYCDCCGKREVIQKDNVWNYVPTNNGRLSFDKNSSTVAFKMPDLCSECFEKFVLSIANKIQNEINEFKNNC